MESSNIENPLQSSIPPPPTKKPFIYLVVSIAFLLVLGGVFLYIKLSRQTSSAKLSTEIKDIVLPSPTPFPFQELTVQYLKNRSYTSRLGELNNVGNSGTYTSYVTNYSSDGLKINGLLTKPTGEMPEGGWPAIVFIHGYIAPSSYETQGAPYSSYVDYFARNGFVVFKIDLRGHGSSEGEPGGGYYGSDYVVDTLNAYVALQSSDFVNKDKIGLWGHSMAGNIVMRGLAAKPEIPAAVIWAGAVYSYTDQQKYGINDNSYRPPENNTQRQNKRRELFEKVGSPSATSVFWKQVAPTNFLNTLKGAIEIHHAVDDPVVNIGYSRDLAALLDETTVPHEFFEYSSGGHNLSGSSFDQAMSRSVDFFKKYLQ